MNSGFLLLIDFQFHSTVVGGDTLNYCSLLKFIKTFLRPSVWLILEDVSHALGKNMFSVVVICVSGWFTVLSLLFPC